MNVQIIGCGLVGSSIANELINTAWDRINTLALVDKNIDVAMGHYKDLKRVIALKEVPSRFKLQQPRGEPTPNGYDTTIITAGVRCYYDMFKTREEALQFIYKQNWPTVLGLMGSFKSDRVIIVTNPAKRIANKLRHWYPDTRIEHAGDKIDKIEDGREIQLLKGSTNWGIAAEVGGML